MGWCIIIVSVNDAEQRGIAIATSKPMGRSQVHFPEREVKNRRMVMELDKGWKHGFVIKVHTGRRTMPLQWWISLITGTIITVTAN